MWGLQHYYIIVVSLVQASAGELRVFLAVELFWVHFVG